MSKNKEKEQEQDDNSENTTKKIVKFALFIILILIILLLHFCVGIDTINDLTPTGNVDIFDIMIDKSCCDTEPCECKCNEKKEKSETTSKTSYSKKKIETDVEEGENIDDIVDALILDDDGRYNNSNDLRIFENPAYKFKNIIAPTSSNVYQFIVRNNNEFNIQYNLVMTEENVNNINMKYRLKMDGEYVNDTKDNWVTYDKLHLEDMPLAAKSKNVYQLEWKWFQSDNDTLVGEIGDEYSLLINFDGEEI